VVLIGNFGVAWRVCTGGWFFETTDSFLIEETATLEVFELPICWRVSIIVEKLKRLCEDYDIVKRIPELQSVPLKIEQFHLK
jgi:hypothetical protein